MARSNKRDISIACFNLLNLGLPGLPIYGKDGWTELEYAAKLAFCESRLAEIDADIIGFQECWDAEALAELFDRPALKDRYDLVARTLSPRGIQVALAARKGMLREEPRWIEELPENARFTDLREARDAEESVTVTIRKFSRPLLRVVVNKAAGSPNIVVYVAHLKSKGPTTLRYDRDNPVLRDNSFIARSVVSHVRRMVEAGAFRAILDDELSGNDRPLVVIGDLNDSSISVSTELLSGNPGYRFFAKSTAGSKSDTGLYSVEKLQQLRSFRHVYYTHIFKNQMESLDHIMVSDSFYDHSSIRKWSFREMNILNDHLTSTEAERRRLGQNDHGIVAARFDWNPMVEEAEKILEEAGSPAVS
ncbi:Endonuclease/Exonuclease/phosphatase family protein [Paracoccus halophilus]|uniref:Endonuclease/Exonuclease/phosphatase family protein n=1 Tax=Paracoccus halophilus TaxID=376733 RepID=A0A1I0TEP0_9RHOB|nr:endonuclease/exonuclease/phosphatase family protein [Paracoccus halophilus]SFA50242.1 Endonuclease/Exonuclease/phosphatase family protein [Paracoccus halophilus]